MKKIYCLKVGDQVFYVGQTGTFLSQRLASHLNGTKGVKELPEWLKKIITIEVLEECTKPNHNSRERYWIQHFHNNGAKLINLNKVKPLSSQPKHKYKTMTMDERNFIRFEVGYVKTAYTSSMLPETLRVSIIKNRIKKSNYDKIFSGDNLLSFNAYLLKCNNVVK